MLLAELSKVHLLDELFNLKVKLLINFLILNSTLVELLLKATLLNSLVSHIVKLSKLMIGDASLILSEELH